MWPREAIIRILRSRGELWEVAPGVTALRGEVAALLRALERAIATLCGFETSDEWRLPPAIDFATLRRADYFASFPQWLTLASHLSDDPEVLRRVADNNDPREAMSPARVALNPAVCYHVYAALAGDVVDAPKIVTAQSDCWRHEGSRHAPLTRGWAFTMREIVCIGSEDDARAVVERYIERVSDLAQALDLDPTIDVATDPFFVPAARAKQMLQQLKELKRELLLPVNRHDRIAAASFNLHDTFFGEAFDIRLANGKPATSACVAFGLERWLLAFLVRYGPDAARWPSVTQFDLTETRHA
jgi:seryl-tRNA synthetase